MANSQHCVPSALPGCNRDTGRVQGVMAPIMANDFVHVGTLARHSPMNSETYAAVLGVLIKEFENRFEDC